MNDGPRAPHAPAVPGLSGFSVLARGGYATVYRATQDSVGREVAVKVENRALESDHDERRFLREARAAGRMSSHPHIVDLFDVGVTVDQLPYLIMELCDGSYADRMRSSLLNAIEARDLGVKLADALAHAHHSGVLHRDVKPANILHSRFNPAVLADFGLAVLAEVRDPTVNLEVLTPAYAPPEMFRHSAPSPAVDVYSLCSTLYAVMSGKPPRWRDDRNPSLITLMELFAEPIPDLPGVPRELIDVLRIGMANDPGSRPYAEQLRDMLAAVPLPAAGPVIPISGPPLSSGGPAFGPPVTGVPSLIMPVSGGASPGAPVSGPPGHPGGGSGADGSGYPGAAPGTAPPDNTPTVQTARRRRRFGWLFGGFGALALLASAGVAALAVAGVAAGGHPAGAQPGPSRARPGVALPQWGPSRARPGVALPQWGPSRARPGVVLPRSGPAYTGVSTASTVPVST